MEASLVHRIGCTAEWRIVRSIGDTEHSVAQSLARYRHPVLSSARTALGTGAVDSPCAPSVRLEVDER